MTGHLTPILHRGCGGQAFLYDNPRPGQKLVHNRAYYADGSHPDTGSLMTCAACGRQIYDTTTELQIA